MTIMPVNPQGFEFRTPTINPGRKTMDIVYGDKPPLAGSYMDPFAFLGSEQYKSASPEDKDFLRSVYKEKIRGYDPAGERLIDWAISQNTPEARQKILEQQLAFDKARGEQMQKYRMTNDIIANLGSAARSAFGSNLPVDFYGQGYANIGNAYLSGRQSVNPVAPQVGQRYF